MKKRWFSLLLALLMALFLVTPALAVGDFTDIPADADYADAVTWCREKGLMDGVGDGRFDPDGTLSRAMLATVLYRAEGEPVVVATPDFTDTQTGAWYASAVTWASQRKLMHGYGNGFFGVNDPVSVEMLDIIMARYQGAEPLWTGDPAKAVPATRAQVATALYKALGDDETAEQGNVLVAYFSCTGTTKSAAENIQAATQGDLFEIVPAQPYTSADLNYNNSSSRSQVEQRDANARPAISSTVEHMDDYDVIFLGYPIWNGRPPKIISTFLESCNFTGKTIIPFCTSGGSGYSSEGLAELTEGAAWLEGRRFSGGVTTADIAEWVDGLNLDLNKAHDAASILRVQCGEVTVIYELNDSPAAQSLLLQLPLTIEVKPYSTNEQTFYPPEKLNITDSPAITSAKAGTLAYYAPWGDVVMFYGDFSGGSGGLYELGIAVEGNDAIQNLSGTITVTVK